MGDSWSERRQILGCTLVLDHQTVNEVLSPELVDIIIGRMKADDAFVWCGRPSPGMLPYFPIVHFSPLPLSLVSPSYRYIYCNRRASWNVLIVTSAQSISTSFSLSFRYNQIRNIYRSQCNPSSFHHDCCWRPASDDRDRLIAASVGLPFKYYFVESSCYRPAATMKRKTREEN